MVAQLASVKYQGRLQKTKLEACKCPQDAGERLQILRTQDYPFERLTPVEEAQNVFCSRPLVLIKVQETEGILKSHVHASQGGISLGLDELGVYR